MTYAVSNLGGIKEWLEGRWKEVTQPKIKLDIPWTPILITTSALTVLGIVIWGVTRSKRARSAK